MLKSLFLKKPTSLSTIGNWLLALPDKGESLEGPPKVSSVLLLLLLLLLLPLLLLLLLLKLLSYILLTV
jgi:hypothetical protein